ncbi:hypothetical protein OUZ56_001597 [Daphnia magna]|uniref:Uncharacterized protein n=1 Tax=Daphnia magna TaxID=35525 RepID=A0ABR0A348_9CRUS|nr:hypothetical protein OUZ56_001597 [Daphnia magna]
MACPYLPRPPDRRERLFHQPSPEDLEQKYVWWEKDFSGSQATVRPYRHGPSSFVVRGTRGNEVHYVSMSAFLTRLPLSTYIRTCLNILCPGKERGGSRAFWMPFLDVCIYKAEKRIGCDLVAIIKFSHFYIMEKGGFQECHGISEPNGMMTLCISFKYCQRTYGFDRLCI